MNDMEARLKEIEDLKKYIIQLIREKEVLLEDRRRLKHWTIEKCTCGGGGPGEGCIACDVYHVADLGRKENI